MAPKKQIVARDGYDAEADSNALKSFGENIKRQRPDSAASAQDVDGAVHKPAKIRRESLCESRQGMLLCQLPRSQISEILDCLGPDDFHFRSVCVLAREISNSVDLAFEILRWHCVNSAFLECQLRCLECLGQIPLKCSRCSARVKGRQMFRLRRSRFISEGTLYICCLCVLREARFFLIGHPDGLIGRYEVGRKARATLLVAILNRAQHPRGGLIADCLASMGPQ